MLKRWELITRSCIKRRPVCTNPSLMFTFYEDGYEPVIPTDEVKNTVNTLVKIKKKKNQITIQIC